MEQELTTVTFMPRVATHRFLTVVPVTPATLETDFPVSVGIFTLHPCSQRGFALKLVDLTRTRLIADASINTDANAFCQWCN